MFRRRDFVAAVLVIYLVLLIFYFATRKHEVSTEVCGKFYACVRFCCMDHDSCSSKYIEKHFNRTLIHKNDLDNDIKTLFGTPNCAKLSLLGPNVQWEFNEFGDITPLSGWDFYYHSDNYCLKRSNFTGSDAVTWSVYYCNEKQLLQRFLDKYLMGAALMTILATMIVYVLSKSLHTVQGRCEFMLLLGLFFIHITYPWQYLEIFRTTQTIVMYSMLIGFITTSLWMNVLVFDIWFTFRNLQTIFDESQRFKRYCWYVFGLTAVILVALCLGKQFYWRLSDLVYPCLLFCFGVSAIVDVILLILSGVQVYKTSNLDDCPDPDWFEAERERFWKYLAAFLIVYIVWPAELSLEFSENIIVVSVVSFSTVVVSINFAWKKVVNLAKPYKVMEETITN